MAEENIQTNAPEQDLSEILKVRREKLAALRAEGRDPFKETRFDVTHHAQDIKDNFDALEGSEVRVAGRLMSKRGMGTTFTALVADGRRIHIAHVGDSRAYLMRSGAISRVTKDHTLVEEMVSQGLITEREARVHPKRNLVTRALGTSRDVDVDLIQLDVRDGEVLLMCSDGLSNYVPEHDMLRVVTGEGEWQDKLKELVRIALDAGGSDNITAMVATFEEENR